MEKIKLPGSVIACSLLIFSSGCSWIQTLEDKFKSSFKRTESMPSALPTVEVPVRMLYPNGTKTIEEAINYMLEPHSYRAAYRNKTGESIAQRTFINNFDNDPVPLYMAMERLLGQNGQIILDKNRKLYTFREKNPDESSVAFADLTTTPVAASDIKSANGIQPPREEPDGLVHDLVERRSPVDKTALHDVNYSPGSMKPEDMPGDFPEFCKSIHFKSQSMLSATVQEYFLACGFDKVFWGLGEPDRYADYRLLQNINLPLPERHHDLIEFLQSRFGIKTLIHNNERVEFYDENYTH